MLDEFKTFIARGNVLDLAVAVIIGAAFGKIVTSLTDDLIMPVIGRVTGGLDFSSYYVVLGTVPRALAGSSDYAALKKAGVPLFGYGAFLTAAVQFLIVAFVIFLLVRAVNRVMPKAEAPVEPAPEPADVTLLREIRDELRGRADRKSGPLSGRPEPVEGMFFLARREKDGASTGPARTGGVAGPIPPPARRWAGAGRNPRPRNPRCGSRRSSRAAARSSGGGGCAGFAPTAPPPDARG